MNLMTRTLAAAAVTFCGWGTVWAQQGDDDVVRIPTSLIEIDLSATDSKGRPVVDLRPDEIELLENGVPRELKHFALISAASAVEARGTEANLISATAKTRRMFVLVIDDLMLSFESARRVRWSVSRFVEKQLAKGDAVAMFTTSGTIATRFTTDKGLLLGATEHVRWNPRSRSGGTGSEANEKADSRFQIASADGLATASLTALNKIVKRTAAARGNKAIVFFSDGFSLLTKNDGTFLEASGVLDSIRKITDSAHRATATIYTIDTTGLDTGTLTAADPTRRGNPRTGATNPALRQRIADNQDGLRLLAKEAGGFAVIDTNDLNGGLARIVDHNAYYILGYEPDEQDFDPTTNRYHQIEIRITRPGVKARYRSGFFGIK